MLYVQAYWYVSAMHVPSHSRIQQQSGLHCQLQPIQQLLFIGHYTHPLPADGHRVHIQRFARHFVYVR